MFLSLLLVDTGGNPDRPRQGRAWIHNPERVHQRLCMAFPSAGDRVGDGCPTEPVNPSGSLRPCPAAGDSGDTLDTPQVHVPRGSDTGFLFRIDHAPASPALGSARAAIIVLSAVRPDWGLAFRNAEHLLTAPPECRPFDVELVAGVPYHFRLRANPTESRPDLRDDRGFGRNWQDGKVRRGRGRRRPVIGEAELQGWIGERLSKAGATLDSSRPPIITHEGILRVRRGKEARRYQPPPCTVRAERRPRKGKDNDLLLRSVRFDGILVVHDVTRFRDAMIRGIGRGKAFGFGLLSIARA